MLRWIFVIAIVLALISPVLQAQSDRSEPKVTSVDISSYINRDGVQNAAPGADFDGAGRSFPAAGIAWGTDVSLRGIRFRLPPAEGPDHVACAGQRIPLPEAASPEWLFVLAAASRDLYQDGLLTLETAAGSSRTPMFSVITFVQPR